VLGVACAGTTAARFRSAAEFSEALRFGVPPKKRLLELTSRTFRRPWAAAVALAAVALAAALLSGRRSSPGRPRVGNIENGEDGFSTTISVSDGTAEGTVLYSFAESAGNSPRKELLHGGFTDPRYWRSFGLVNVRREYRLVRWDPHARGVLKLMPELPDQCRIAFDLEISALDRELDFAFVPTNRARTIRFRLSGKDGTLRLSALRGGEESGNVSAVIPGVGKNHVEFVRSARGIGMSLNGKNAFKELRFPRGGNFLIGANCGKDTSVTLTDFRVSSL